MSYTITIGEAVLITVESEFRARYEVLLMNHENAPEPFINRIEPWVNRIKPSYILWNDVMYELKLGGLFYGDLMKNHPGIKRLNTDNVIRIKDAVNEYMKNHRAAVVDLSFPISYERQVVEHGIWLAWWVEWAVSNCKNPAIHNS